MSSFTDKPPIRLVIVGRPNVGKSTLFNRLLGRRRALVHNLPGVTRDRLEEPVKWWVKGKALSILLVDTGGLGGDKFAVEIERQVEIGLSSADVVLVMFDAQTGLTPLDRDVLKSLKRSGLADRKDKLIIGVVNKVDVDMHEERIADFYATGLDPILTISAEHGRGIADLQEEIASRLGLTGTDEEFPVDDDSDMGDDDGDGTARDFAPESEEAEGETRAPGIPKIAIVGRPNVGKSTLTNSLIGEERMIASPIAGTTIDAVDSAVELNGKPFIFIDTAGIRRKSKTEQGVEVLSVVQARKALDRCDVAILLLDGETGITDQDEKIGGLIEEVGCGVVLIVNKWDTQRKQQDFTREIAADIIRKEMAYLRYAPILFTSALEGKGFEDLGDLILEILEQRKVKVVTHEFTEWVRKEAEIHNPMNAKFFLCHQSGRYPPTFVCHVNDPDKVHFSLRRHLMNALREKWGYMGSPVRLLFVQGKNSRPVNKKKAAVSRFRRKVIARRK